MFGINHLSRSFMEFVKSIGESRSKQEEDQIILREIQSLRKRFNEPDLSCTTLKEYLVRAMYIEMLGHNSSFAYIHAVKLTQSKNLMCKKVGYLFCTLCFDSTQELLLLLINTIQKDLQSSNYIEVDMALSCICKLLNHDMIAVILPAVLNLSRKHPKEAIRKKGCMALRAVYLLQPHLVQRDLPAFVRASLCDPNLSVVGASLQLLCELFNKKRDDYMDLVPSLVSILKKILEKRIPRDYDYHFVPAPWIQIKLLSILGIMGKGNPKCSDEIHEILYQVLQKTDLRSNVSFAIIYEAVKTVTSVFCSQALLMLASDVVSKFITSDNTNLKYVGITGLASLVRLHPSFAAQPEHQLVVLDALEDSDETLQRKTLELLYCIANPSNAVAIVEKLLFYMETSMEKEFLVSLAHKICRLMDRFSTNQLWYITTLNKVLLVGADLMPKTVSSNLLRLVAEGPTGNEEEDNLFRQEVSNIYITLLKKESVLPETLLRIAVWIIGEYGSFNTLTGYETLESLIELLVNCLNLKDLSDTSVYCLITAIFKLSVTRLISLVSNVSSSSSSSSVDILNQEDSFLASREPLWPPHNFRVLDSVLYIVKSFSSSPCLRIMQQCLEFQNLILKPEPGEAFATLTLLRELYPFDGACEDINFEEELSFLDDFVHDALRDGAQPYKPLLKNHVKPSTSSSLVPFDYHEWTGFFQASMGFHAPLTTPTSDLPLEIEITSCQAPQNSCVSVTKSPFQNHLLPNIWSSNLETQYKEGEPNHVSPPESNIGNSFVVQGPRVWGPSGYEPRHSFISPVSDPPSNTLKAQPVERKFSHDSQGRGESLTHEKVLTSEKQRAALRLFCGLTSESPKNKDINPPSMSTYVEPFSSCCFKTSQNESSCLLIDSSSTVEKLKSLTPDLLDVIWENPSCVKSPLTSVASDTANSSHECFSEKDSPLFLNSINKKEEALERSSISCHSEAPLKPLEISIKQVEKDWSFFLHEKGEQIPTSLSDPIIAFQKIQNLLGVAVVEIIGNEGIFAGSEPTLNFSSSPSLCYLHAQLTPNHSIDFIFKANNMLVLDLLSQRCRDFFNQH